MKNNEWPGNAKWAGVARFGGVGDNLIAASVLKPLKQQGYLTEVITSAPQSVVFENNPHLDCLTVKQKGDIPEPALEWQNWFVGRSHEYAKFANLSHSCEYSIALFASQTAFWWPPDVRRKLCGRNYLEAVHDILQVPYVFGKLFYPTAEERALARKTKRKIGKRCIAWCLSGTRVDKVYPFAPLAIARIIKEMGIPVVMVGAPGIDFTMAKIIMEHVARQNGSTDGLHLALSSSVEKPNWPIRRVLTMVQHCDLVIAPDTGPAWAAAFEPMPKVMLLSHASAENITKHWVNTTTLTAAPLRVPCYPCHRLHDTYSTCTPNADNTAAACMTDIGVERLLQAVAAAAWR